MAQKAAIISAAEQQYYPLLRGLIQSLRDQGCADSADLCVIDVGMAPEQRAELEPLVTTVADGRWDLEFPLRPKAPRWFQAMVARPHLPAYFPGYDIYAWIDADAWVADNRVIQLLLDGAREEGLTLVPEIHPTYHGFKPGRQSEPPGEADGCYLGAWGQAVARRVGNMPVLNSGVFAMQRDHPCWNKWSGRLRDGLQNSSRALIEQCALNVTLYHDGVPFAPLPAWCNWICNRSPPRYNRLERRFEEPMRPHVPISLIHTGAYKYSGIKLPAPGGQLVEVPFSYRALKEGHFI